MFGFKYYLYRTNKQLYVTTDVTPSPWFIMATALEYNIKSALFTILLLCNFNTIALARLLFYLEMISSGNWFGSKTFLGFSTYVIFDCSKQKAVGYNNKFSALFELVF